MRAFVAVTDDQWFRFLRSQDEADEVNFWQPSGSSRFRALQPGQPFLFKLHHPENFIVGGGFFATFSILPSRLVWEAFGVKNGAASYTDMWRRIARYRRQQLDARDDPMIGNIILVDPFFFTDRDWIPAPGDFSPNIVRGKGYDLATSPGRELWEEVLARRAAYSRSAGIGRSDDRAAEQSMFGEPVPVRQRLGQGGFRIMVTEAYSRRCGVTGERALPALQAAHIRPVMEGGRHMTSNGLLLRSDIHALYDRGYVTITPDLVFRTSRRLKTDFENGEEYRRYEGGNLFVPADLDDRPDREYLEWHADVVFKR